MKFIILAAAMLSVATTASAQSTTQVRGHFRSDGTYVQPHQRTTPNRTLNDNWSTRGNTNPNTGVAGTRPRDEDVGYRPYKPYKPYKPR